MKTTITQHEALTRATNSQSVGNYAAIFAGFMARGIPEKQIEPRVNVFTYDAWRALGRFVRKGEHGVQVATIRHLPAELDAETGDVRRPARSAPWRSTVFHITQTEPVKA